MPVELSQPKRVRAARGAVNMSLDDFADAVGIGRSTLVRIEAGKRTAELPELQRMAEASGLPLGFFVVEDLIEVLDGQEEPTLRGRVGDLERSVTELRAGLASLAADNLRRTREQQARGDTDRPEERPGGGS